MEIQLNFFKILKKLGFQIYVKEGVHNSTCHTLGEMEQGKYLSKQR
jgi:hypothetical protein